MAATPHRPNEVKLPEPLPNRLNLGCGQFPRAGFLNVDWDPTSPAEVHLNLNDPASYEVLPTGHFELVVMDHCLEHLSDVFGVIRAVHRLLATGGRLEIRVPHFSRGMTHPEHCHGFDVTFPEYLNPSFRGGYIGVPFRLESLRLDYMIGWDLKRPFLHPWQEQLLKCVNGVLTWLANVNPYACSRFWCYGVGGFEQIEFILIKESPDG